MAIDRRNLLKSGLAGLPFCLMGRSLGAFATAADRRRQTTHAPTSGNRRLLTIFLRGGNDGLNTIVPHGDANYTTLRPNIWFGKAGSGAARETVPIPGYSDVGMHPALSPLLPLMQGTNRVAFLHRIGNFTCERSHFTEMHLVETGRTDHVATAQGWLPQLLPLIGTPPAIMPAVSVSERLQRMYLSPQPGKAATHIQGAYSEAALRRLTVPFAEPGTPDKRVADAVASSIVNGLPAYPIVGQGTYLRDNAVDAINDLANLRANLPAFPHNEARYPFLGSGTTPPWPLGKYATFFARLEEAVQYLNGGFAKCVGLEVGGWDTHDNQLASHQELLSVLGHALRSANDHLAEIDPSATPFLIYVVSEFGRTAKDNGSGTDHGVGGLAIAVGSTVLGGVYNCYGSGFVQNAGTPTGVAPWTPLTGTGNPPFTNAVVPATDFRVPFLEIARTFFGLTPAEVAGLDQIGSLWNVLQTSGLTEHRLLDFLV